MNDKQLDQQLNIITTGDITSHSDHNHYPYEPTSYDVIQRLIDSKLIGKDNVFVDYGCGKGRVDFYISHLLHCPCIGIEYEPSIYNLAINNLNTFNERNKISFININAEEYKIPSKADCFYFFNPFSVKTLSIVIEKIIYSFYEHPRNIRLFFYYPSDEYLSYLLGVRELLFLDEIECHDLFDGNNQQETILVFEIDDYTQY